LKEINERQNISTYLRITITGVREVIKKPARHRIIHSCRLASSVRKEKKLARISHNVAGSRL